MYSLAANDVIIVSNFQIIFNITRLTPVKREYRRLQGDKIKPLKENVQDSPRKL